MGLGSNKKGALEDVVYILVTLLVVAMMFLIGFKFVNELNTNFQASDVVNADGKTASQKINDLYPTVMDNAFLYLTIGLMIVTIVLAMLVVFHPVFFVFYLILLPIVIFIGGVASNIYQEMAANTEIASIANQLTFTSYVLNYLPIILGVFSFILAIIMFKTWQDNR